ncbi:MAG: integral rane protein MviN [Thermomicrobiales bacterium]|nr:integral rane protein MviN [Thermomicrobiales bacterium]MCD6056899.1 integral rane protein MviN [Thermomicrobiales bacterium]MDF2757490.1 integral rane protein MviN [Thermomicrobiales bacterium]
MRTSDPHRPGAEQVEVSPTPGSPEWPSWPRLGAPVSERDWGSRRRQASLARSAGIVAGSFVVSRVLGLVREIVLARQFGTSEAFSAYVSAFRIPDLLFLVVMAGAFGSAFIPVFSGFLGDGEDEAAWKLASVVLNVSGLVVIFAAALAWAFAPELVRYVVAPEASTAAQQITVNCMRVLLLSPVFLGFGIAAKGILEGQDLFTLPALAPIAYNTATILGAIVLGPRVGVYGVAIGVVVGAIGFLLLEIPGLVRSGMRYSISFDPRAPGVSEVGRLLAPRLIGQAAFQLNFVAVTNLAWRTGDQSVSALNYAWQLLMLPHGVLALSVSTVILPTLSRLWQVGDTVAFRATLGNALRPLLFLSLPAAVILFAFRVPIVQTLFQTGAFSAESTSLVAAPLAFLATGLVSYALVEALTRAFYAMHDTRTPVIAGIGIIALNILMGVALLDRMGYLGLALALSLSTTVEAIVLIVVLGRRIGSVTAKTRDWLLRLMVSSAVTALVAAVLANPLTQATLPGNGPRLQQIIVFLFALSVVGLVYLGCAWILRIPELSDILDQLSRRIPPLRRLATPARR